MKYLVAMDSFKGSLTSLEAGYAVKEAIMEFNNENEVIVKPLADGGEGTMKALTDGLGGELYSTLAKDPLGRYVTCNYGMIEKNTAIIEIAEAAGLTRLSEDEKNPLYTSTYGVGELIIDAYNRGARRFIIGLGGSATNDGGVGMLSALGFSFLDKDNNDISYGAEGLKELAYINDANAFKDICGSEFIIACDVDNPLCGLEGCSYVFAPQKGARKEEIECMDKWLLNYADIVKKYNKYSNPEAKGSGAAGGLGFAFLSFFNAKLISGIELVIKELGITEYIKTSDIVITGEGKLDGQSIMGKAPIGVSKIAKKYGKKVIALAGIIGDGVEACLDYGVSCYSSINDSLSFEEKHNIEYCMRKDVAINNIKTTVKKLCQQNIL